MQFFKPTRGKIILTIITVPLLRIFDAFIDMSYQVLFLLQSEPMNFRTENYPNRPYTRSFHINTTAIIEISLLFLLIPTCYIISCEVINFHQKLQKEKRKLINNHKKN